PDGSGAAAAAVRAAVPPAPRRRRVTARSLRVGFLILLLGCGVAGCDSIDFRDLQKEKQLLMAQREVLQVRVREAIKSASSLTPEERDQAAQRELELKRINDRLAQIESEMNAIDR